MIVARQPMTVEIAAKINEELDWTDAVITGLALESAAKLVRSGEEIGISAHGALPQLSILLEFCDKALHLLQLTLVEVDCVGSVSFHEDPVIHFGEEVCSRGPSRSIVLRVGRGSAEPFRCKELIVELIEREIDSISE